MLEWKVTDEGKWAIAVYEDWTLRIRSSTTGSHEGFEVDLRHRRLYESILTHERLFETLESAQDWCEKFISVLYN